MKKVFVSGCYDIVHAGHIQFFEEARALGDYLIVSFASEPVLWHHKQRKPSIPDEHKKVLLESLRMVDKVILGTGMKKGLDFEEEFLQEKPDILAVTEDDLYSDIKKELCARVGASYIVNVVRCNERYAAPAGDLKQCAVDLLLLRHSVILKLEIEAVLTEDIAQPLRLAQRAVEIRCEYHRRNYSTETSG